MSDFDVDNSERTPLTKSMLRSQEQDKEGENLETSVLGGLLDFQDGNEKVSKFHIRSIVGLLA